jgi:cell division protein FtsZ
VSIVASGMNRAGEAERRPPAPAEDWIRGSKPAAPTRPAGRAEPARPAQPAKGFAPEAPREHRSGAQDLQQRLTEALQYPATTQPFGTQRAQPANPGYEAPRSRGGESWRGPGNVTIEEGPPQFPSATTPPPLPQGYAAPHHGQGGSFAPQPPSDVRRQARWAPDQADYAAGQRPPYREAPYSEAQPLPEQRQAPVAEPRRRLGLFERIAGRVRGTGDSDTRQPIPTESYPQDPQSYPQGASDNETYERYTQSADDYEHDRQAAELPVFFRERRR